MHAHFGDPLVVDSNYFYKISQGKTGIAILEGYVIFDLDHSVEVKDVTGKMLGKADVIFTLQTKISSLSKKYLKSAGHASKEFLRRDLIIRYPHKKIIEWITVVKFLPTIKMINREENMTQT